MKPTYMHICIWALLGTFLPGCLIPNRYFMRRNIFIKQPCELRIEQTHYAGEKPIITVWVHGTRFFYHRLYQDNIPHLGLVRARDVVLSARLKSIGPTLAHADGKRFKSDHFYLFGWSGKLCFVERELAAQHLHEELKHLIDEYTKIYNCTPYLRIIAHSHGGNVALNLAQYEDQPTIDELILLACPVQEKTKNLIKNPVFKKAYALYSAMDIVQIIDPQGMYKDRGKAETFFSKRHFPHREQLAQVKIKIDRRAITHFEFTQPPFLRLLPKILTGIDQWHDTISYPENPEKMHKVLCVYTKTPRTKIPAVAV